jgi:hypothetical protein
MEERKPYLKALTSVTCGENEIVDQKNLMESLMFHKNYRIFSEFLLILKEKLKLDEIEIAEGFVSKLLSVKYNFEVHDEDSFFFRNLIFKDTIKDSEELFNEIIEILNSFSFKKNIKSLLLDKDSGFLLLKLKSKEDDEEIECIIEE